MVAPLNTKQVLDDARYQIQVLDMRGGLNTQQQPIALGPTQTPDAVNVFSVEGDLQFRGGYQLFANLASQADAMYTFFDVNGNRHVMVWSAGSLYDCTSGVQVLITAAVYTTGQQIAVTALNKKMYWATATVALRQYDGTTEAAVTNSGAVGSVAPPKCFYLMTYQGSLVAFRPVVGATTFENSFMWCNVNDPTTWLGANIQGVGSNDGGAIMWGITQGVPSFVVGKSVGASSTNLWNYSGALGTLTQTGISCQVGAFDPNSAVLVPGEAGISDILFIASDGHFWKTNGVEAILACENIMALAESYVRNAVLLNPNTKFFATYYTRWQYYVCNVGQNTQLIYRPDDGGAWWLFSGWPNGPFTSFISTSTGLPGLFTAANNSGTTGLYQVAIDQANDNGASIFAYYTTPYLHGGKLEREKQYDWFCLMTLNVGTRYTVDGEGLPWFDNTFDEMDQLVFQDPGVLGANPTSGGIWDVSLWDEALWGGGLSQQAQPYQPVLNHGPIEVTFDGNEWVPAGEKAPLKTPAAKFKISYLSGVPDFRVIGYNMRYLEGSAEFAGMGQYQAVGVVNDTTNAFTTVGEN